MKLGKLEKIELRKFWAKEDTDFTPWLAQEENIKILSETIGIGLVVMGQEESVGPFRADILCKDISNDHYVLIENQLEKTDHTHLGQLLTYAAGLDAVSVIWIAKNFTEEHRAALDWLNRITDDTFNFFGIEIELYKIGNSAAAPLFKIISKPNDWSKRVKTPNSNLTETKLLQQEYWNTLRDYMIETNSNVTPNKGLPQNWTNMAIGKSDIYLSAQLNSKEKTIAVWLNFTGDNAKENFDRCYDLAFERAKHDISDKIIWDRMEGRKMSCAFIKTKGDFTKRDDWQNQFAWYKENLEKFAKLFRGVIREI
jgi:hypothetical protein